MLCPIAVIAPNGLAVLLAVLGLSVVVSDRAARRLAGIPMSVGLPVGGLLAWAFTSAIWSPDPGMAAEALVRISIAAYFGLAVSAYALAMDGCMRVRIESHLLGGFLAGLAIVALEIASRTAFGRDGSLFVIFFGPQAQLESFLNRPKTVLAIVLPLVLSVAWRRRGAVAVVAILSICGAVFVIGESLASAAALAVAAAGAAAGLVLAGKGGRGIFAAAIAAFILTAPMLAGMPEMAELGKRRDITVSIYHRAVIWGFVSEKIDEKPILGWGMHASRNVPGGREQIAAFAERMPLHPHNAPLQIRLELGLVGALLAAAFAAAVAHCCGGSLSRRVALMSTFASALFVASVSYGIWQGWWYSTLWLVGGLAVVIGRQQDTGEL